MAKKNRKNLGNPMAIMAAGNAVKNMQSPQSFFTDEKKNIRWFNVIAVAAGAYVVYNYTPVGTILRGFLKLNNVLFDKSEDKKAVEAFRESDIKNKAFNPNYFLSFGNEIAASLAGNLKIMGYAKVIKEAFGWVITNDEEEKIGGVFDQIKNFAECSALSYHYFRYYKIGLYDELEQRLSSEEMNKYVISKIKLLK